MSLRELGYSDGECLDYDFAHVDFFEWFTAMQEEQKPVPESSVPKLPNNGKGWTWGRKYSTLESILDQFGRSAIVSAKDDPDVRAVDIPALLTDWNPWEQVDDDE